MGVSHYRRRKTTHEVTATSENGVHVPGQNFFSTQKNSVAQASEHHVIDTGAAHKSVRTIQNMKTQITLKGETQKKTNKILTDYTPISFGSPGLRSQNKLSITKIESRKSILKN